MVVKNKFCNTSYAASVLKLSVSTIQTLVDTNKLVAWKTPGGHRRISLSSIIDFQKENNSGKPFDEVKNRSSQILIVEDDENTRTMYEEYFETCDIRLDVIIYPSASEALEDIHLIAPIIILTDLKMSNMTGLKFIQAVREIEEYSSLPIIAMTGMTHEEINNHGGLTGDVMILNKPIDMKWLMGLLQGIVSMLDNK